jgi:tripartite-type tricarboxylate transporter receptor subunit TctC
MRDAMKKNLILILLSFFMIHTGQILAQNYPNKTIRLVVPSAAGGTIDIIARGVVQKMSESLKQPIIIDNRPGASGIIAMDIVAKSPPDGYTLILATSGTFAANLISHNKLPFDIIKDFSPVSIITESTFALAIHPSLQINSLQDFTNLAKSKPNTITYGSFGIGSISHILTESFNIQAGIQLTHIPYKSGPDTLNGLIGGQVSSSMDALTVLLPQLKSKRIQILAIGNTKRSPLAPDIPTFIELGYTGYTAMVWYGLFAPGNTPKDIISKLNSEIMKSLAESETKEKLQSIGLNPIGSSPDGLAQQIKLDIEKFTAISSVSKFVQP